MELWQQLGFKSFGDWRRASERARKAQKKKAAAPASVIASAVAGHGCDVDTAPDPPDDVRVAWQPLRQLDPPSPHRVNSPHAAERLPGNLHEHVEVTPRGSRAHKIKHTSPGGTTRCEEYVSPAGARQKLEERNAWRLHVAAARREERAARESAASEEKPARTTARLQRSNRGVGTQRSDGAFDRVPGDIAWRSCPLFGGAEVELEIGFGESGYFGVHKINETTYKARRYVRGTGYVHVWTSQDPRECAAVLAREKHS